MKEKIDQLKKLQIHLENRVRNLTASLEVTNQAMSDLTALVIAVSSEIVKLEESLKEGETKDGL